VLIKVVPYSTYFAIAFS